MCIIRPLSVTHPLFRQFGPYCECDLQPIVASVLGPPRGADERVHGRAIRTVWRHMIDALRFLLSTCFTLFQGGDEGRGAGKTGE